MIFREMRRRKQELSRQEVLDVLYNGTSGVLALLGDNDYPYAVPISYVYDDGKIYFHSAKSGHKIDAIQKTEKASFCVIDKDLVVPEEYTTYFRSVIAFGKIRVIEDDREKRAGAGTGRCQPGVPLRNCRRRVYRRADDGVSDRRL